MGLNFFGLGDSEVSNVAIPEWEEDPFYKRTQDVLAPFGENLLSGDIPDYYSAIGDIGGKAFEDMLKLNVRDVNKSIDESSALQGIRGPRSAAIKASSISDLTKKMRYEDMLRGVEGKKFLMGSGLNTLSGVRGSSLDWMGMKIHLSCKGLGWKWIKQSIRIVGIKSKTPSKANCLVKG